MHVVADDVEFSDEKTATLENSSADPLTRILNKIERSPIMLEARKMTS